MASLASLSDAINRLTGGSSGTPETLFFNKNGRYGGAALAGLPIAGRWFSTWMLDGVPAGATTAPSTWANPDNTTQGGLLQTDPGGSRQKWLMQFSAACIQAGTFLLYDRLGHNGGLNATTTTAQTFTGTLNRYNTSSESVGNFMFYEIYGNTASILGSTGTTMTVEYTNQAGTTGRVSPAVAIGATGFREGNQARIIPLAAGDTGIQSVQNVDLLATTGTAGNFGITVGHPLAYLPVSVLGGIGWRDFVTGLPGIPEIKTDACLAMLFLPNTVTIPELTGMLSMVEA
jgi:hypothetical protein